MTKSYSNDDILTCHSKHETAWNRT